MKKIITIIGIALLISAFGQTVNAQITGSVGLEVALPFESGIGIGFGLTGGAEYELNDNAGITGQLGYIFLTTEAKNSSSALIPFQFGYKYYLDAKDQGLYLHGQLGFHTYRYSYDYEYASYPNGYSADPVYKTETYSFSSTRLSMAIGGGYMINENIDLGLRYNMIFVTGGFNYLGLRAAYNF